MTTVEEYLKRGVKEVLDENPEIGRLLDDFGIGCAGCAVGTCLLGDIVEIHALAPEAERALMTRLAGILGLEAAETTDTAPPNSDLAPERPAPPRALSPPMRKLMGEHEEIKRLLASIPAIVRNLNLETEEGRRLVLETADFIREYADRYHHAKEEEILFTSFDGDLEIVRAMREEHEIGRAHVRAVREGVEDRDPAAVREHLLAYRDLLTEHIRKEDEVLYPWMDRSLSTTEIGRIYARFRETEAEFGERPGEWEEFARELEERFAGKEKEDGF